MNALEKIADAFDRIATIHVLRALIKLAQVSSSTETGLQGTVNDHRVGIVFRGFQRAGEFLEIFQRSRANLVTRSAMERELDHAVLQFPRKRLALEILHTACLTSYISSICGLYRAAIKSRFNFPFAVSNPFSIENVSSDT